MDAPNVIWYGDLKTVTLQKKIRTGIFSTQRITLGFRYCIGLEMALSHGPVDALLEVRSKDKIAFTGNVLGISDAGEDFTVDARTLFGGDSEEQLQSNGTGGLYAACTFYKGTGTQNPDPYMASILATDVPAHRNICYVVWKGPSSGNLVYNYNLGGSHEAFTREPFLSGYVGVSPNIEPIAFVIKRCPNMLSTDLSDTYYNINSGDANPADCLFELLTNDEWGMGASSALIDAPSFKYAQTTLYNEGLGFSSIWDSPRQITDVIEEILKYIDGVIYVDLTTGLITLKLARDDYDINNVLTLDEDSIVEITEFSRGAWDETTNEVIVTYVDRFQKFKEKTAIAQDLANARIQDDIISAKIAYNGCSNQTTAGKLAFRDLKVLTIPLIKCSIKMNRKGIVLRPGMVFKLIWPDYEVEQVIFRCIRVNYGELANGQMEVEAVQDVFSLSESSYGTGDQSQWVNPVHGATLPTTFRASEAPYFYTNDVARLQVFVAQPDSAQLSFNTYTSSSSSGTYTQVEAGDTFTPTGTLYASLSAITADVYTTGIEITPSNPNNLLFLRNFTADSIKTGENLFLITDGTKQEICAFESVTFNSGTGRYTLTNTYRGLIDTVPQSWSAGARVWFYSYGDSLPPQNFSPGTVYVEIESVAAQAKSSFTSPTGVTIVKRALKPYPPGYFRLNTSTSTTSISNGSNIVVDWEARNRVTQGEMIYKQFDTGIVAEARTDYYIKFFGETNNLLRTVGPLTTLTYTYTNANQVTDNGGTEPKIVTPQLFIKRDGYYSLYAQQRTLIRTGGVDPGAPPYNPGSDVPNPPPPGDSVSLAGIPLCRFSIPTNGQVLTFDATNNCWKAQDSTAPDLVGDAIGPITSNTVIKIQNRDLDSSAPNDNDAIVWSVANNRWEPGSISSNTSGSNSSTIFSDTSENHTTNNTWEDVGDMTLAITPVQVSNLVCMFTCEVVGISADNEHISFRFLLDGTTSSEVYTRAKDTFPANNEKHVINVHSVFENVSASASHNIKVQCKDDGSNLDITILNRRFTMINCGSSVSGTGGSFDPLTISGLQYWFSCDKLTGYSNNAKVNSMLDFSTNGRHFPAFGTSSPDTRGIYKTAQINSLPALQFNHDGNALTTTNSRYDSSPFANTWTEGEIFLVVKADADPAVSNLQGCLMTWGSDSAQVMHFPRDDGPGSLYDDWGSTVRKSCGNPSVSLASWNVYSVSSKAGEWVCRLNGNIQYSTTTNTPSWISTLSFGGNNGLTSGAGWFGLLAEAAAFDHVLNSTDRLNFLTYLQTKYGL